MAILKITSPMTHPASFPWVWLWQILTIIAGLWLFFQFWQLWLLVFSALILAAAMLPIVHYGERWRMPRTLTVFAIYLGVGLILWLAGRFLVPVIVEDGNKFAHQLPAIAANIKGWLGDLSQLGEEWAIPLPEENWDKIGPTLIENIFRASARVIGGVLGFLLVIFLAAYIVVDAKRISHGLLALVRPAVRLKVAVLAEAVLQRMGGYVRGQIVASGCIGIILTLGLWLLDVPYALLIGGLAAALNVIPFLGATLASVLGILTALNISLSLAIWTALLFWGANLIEGKLLIPQIVGRATGLHPLIVMLGILAGAKLGGLVGALVATPLLAGGWEILRALWVAPINAEESVADQCVIGNKKLSVEKNGEKHDQNPLDAVLTKSGLANKGSVKSSMKRDR